MNIALIGYGRMGHMVEQVALERGHTLVCRIDKGDEALFGSPEFRKAEVAIEFSTPATAVANIHRAWQAHIPVVSGTTGWHEQLPALQTELLTNGEALLWSSNFSIGVNLFFALNEYLATQMSHLPQYEPSLEEIHHIHKLDRPSGTAVTLAQALLEHLPQKDHWYLQPEETVLDPTGIPIRSIREGEIPGTHSVLYQSEHDTVQITHTAHSRAGFALGAVQAAEFLVGKHGFYTMADLLHTLINETK